MPIKPMYKGMPFSPPTTIASTIGAGDTTITVVNGDALPDGPNYAVIGTDESGEVISYAVKAGNTLSGCTRGVAGTAQEWNAGSAIGRNWTSTDFETLIDNITTLNNEKAKKATGTEGNFAALDAEGNPTDSGKKPADFVAAVDGKGLSTNDYTNEDKAEVEKVKNKADKSTAPTATLTVEGWTGDVAPYTQTVAMSGITASTNFVIGLSESATTEEQDASRESVLFASGQGDGTVTINAKNKPSIPLPVTAIIIG